MKQCGTGEAAEKARKGEDAHLAFAGGEKQRVSGSDSDEGSDAESGSGLSLTDMLRLRAFLDDNDDGFDDETLELTIALAKLKGEL